MVAHKRQCHLWGCLLPEIWDQPRKPHEKIKSKLWEKGGVWVLGSTFPILTVTEGGHYELFGNKASEKSKCGSLVNNPVTQGNVLSGEVFLKFFLTEDTFQMENGPSHFLGVLEANNNLTGSFLICCYCSVSMLYSTLCHPMNCSTLGFPVLHYLPESAQTHVHWICDAIQPSHALLPSSPPALNFCQHQSLFQWASSSHQVTKVSELQFQH